MADDLFASPTEMSGIPALSVHDTDGTSEEEEEEHQHQAKGHDGHLTPRPRSPHQAQRSQSSEFELEWFDDTCHEEYEWVRLPKVRDWDILSFLKHSPEQRNTANTPLTARRHDGKEVVMWAKMDTGADVNTINESTLSALLGDTAFNWKKPLSESPDLKDFHDLNLIGDQHFEPTHYVELSFHAGKNKKPFGLVPFVVVSDDAVKASQDGVPNVILGLRTLWEHYMVMVDIEYLCEADSALEVIAEKAEEEFPGGGHHIGVVKYPPVKGVPASTIRGKPGTKRRSTKITMTAEGARVQSWGL